MSLSQALCAAYRLSQSIRLEPSRTGRVQMAVTIGLRDEYDCGSCTDSQKEERGGCPYAPALTRGLVPQLIDSTGDDSHDLIHVCPQGLALRYPLLRATVSTFHEAQGAGGAPAWFGAPLCVRPLRLRTTWAVLAAAETRLQSAVSQARRQMDG